MQYRGHAPLAGAGLVRAALPAPVARTTTRQGRGI